MESLIAGGMVVLAVGAVAGLVHQSYKSKQTENTEEAEPETSSVRSADVYSTVERSVDNLKRAVYSGNTMRSRDEWLELIRDIRELQRTMEHTELNQRGYGVHFLDTLARQAMKSELVNTSLPFIGQYVESRRGLDWYVSQVPYRELSEENVKRFTNHISLSQCPDVESMEQVVDPEPILVKQSNRLKSFQCFEMQLPNGNVLIAQKTLIRE